MLTPVVSALSGLVHSPLSVDLPKSSRPTPSFRKSRPLCLQPYQRKISLQGKVPEMI